MVEDEEKQLEKQDETKDKNLLDHVKDGVRNAQDTKNTLRKMITFVTSIPAILKFVILISTVLIVVGLIEGFLNWLHNLAFEKTIDTIYEEYNVSDIKDLVEIAGDSTNGYYWQFKSGVEEHLQDIIDKINETNPAIITQDKSTILKFFQAEVITQLPNLGGPTENLTAVESQGVDTTQEQTPNVSAPSNLDNFLFIGDSRYAGNTGVKLRALGKNVKVSGVVSAGINEWEAVARNGGKGTVQGINVDITGEYSGISIQLGANSVYSNTSNAVDSMKRLITYLMQLHPYTPIYVNSCIQINPKANEHGYGWNAQAMKSDIDVFNNDIMAYCNQTSILHYVDLSSGMNDGEGYLKSEYTSDGIHCNNTGIEIVVGAIKNGIIASNANNSTVENTDPYKSIEEKVQEKLAGMTLEEKVSQMFMVMTNSGDELKQDAGGYVLNWGNNSSAFTNVESAINSAKSSNKIPAIYATDDEGGQVQRVGSNFPSAQSYGENKNYEQLKADEEKKAELLLSKGINLNLAPVADLSSKNSYMGQYGRSFGEDVEVTSKCVKTVVEAAKSKNLSTCLKHFPGYGNNVNTHDGIARDQRSLATLKSQDLKVFQAGIEAGAPTILVSHNIINSVDSDLPASLSLKVHNIIRNDLDFDGVVMTDDLGMQAIGNNYTDVAVKAVQAGNDMLMTYNFDSYKKSILDAIENGQITEARIDQSVKRILEWKYKYNIITENGAGTSTSDEPLEVAPLGEHPFQGTIDIKRVTPNKRKGEMIEASANINELSFVEENVFNSLVSQNDERALGVYTLNSKKELITATWYYNSETGLTISKGRAINYNSAMNKYTMPFEYLLCFLISGSDVEFAENLAQLAMDSEIVLAIQDKVTTSQTVEYRYDEFGNEIPYTITTESCSPTIELTYADCWFVKFYKDQSYSSDNSNVKVETTNNGSSITNQYTSGESHAVGNERKFIDIFRKSEAIGNITDDWLYQLMEKSSKTSNMIELTKYLFACVKDEANIGNKDLFDFSIYEDNKFTTANGGGRFYGNSFEEKVWWALLDAGYSKIATAGAMGNFANESGFRSNNMQNSYEGTYNDQTYTEAVNNGSYKNFKTDSIGYGLAQWTDTTRKTGLYDYAQKKGVGIDDENMQIEFLLAEMSEQSGGADGCAVAQFGSGRNAFMQASTPQEAAYLFFKYFERPGNASSPARERSALEIYNKYKDLEKPTYGIATMEGWSTKGVSCPRYKQSDSRWASYPYYDSASGTIGAGGCGACALAMAVSGLLQQEITPIDIVEYLNSLGIGTVNNGAASSQAIAKKYGLTYEWIDRYDKANIDAALDAGKCCIFSIDANGIYTGGGHFIMCNGREGDQYYVLESASYYAMDQGYRYNQVFSKGVQGVFVLGR